MKIQSIKELLILYFRHDFGGKSFIRKKKRDQTDKTKRIIIMAEPNQFVAEPNQFDIVGTLITQKGLIGENIQVST